MTIAGLTQHLKPFYYRVRHGNTTLAADRGKVFIDGDDFALRLSATGHYSLRCDWGGICERVDEFMNYWKDWDIGTIMFDGQGPEIDRTMSQQEVDNEMRNMATLPYLGGRPNSVSAIVYDYLRQKYPHLNVIATPTAEKLEILASTVYQYAKRNRHHKVFLLGTDNKYASFFWPENVNLCHIHALKNDWEISQFYPPRMLKVGLKLHCFELAFLCMEQYKGKLTFHQAKKWLRTNDKYHQWREHQQRILDTKHKLIRPYKHIDPENDCFEVQRVLNTIRNTGTLYKQMPLLCEPFWAESAWMCGREWRSLAYQLMVERVSHMLEKSVNFVEGRREGSSIEMTKIPITDAARYKGDYIYPTKARMLNHFQTFSLKNLKFHIKKEIFKYMPAENLDKRLDYDEDKYKEVVDAFMSYIWAPNRDQVKRDYQEKTRQKVQYPAPHYRRMVWEDQYMHMNPACLRVYNKFYACIYSLIMLQSVIDLPYHFTMADLDSILWVRFWKRKVGDPGLTEEQLAAMADPPHLTDQFYTYYTDLTVRRELDEARLKCLRLINEGKRAELAEAEEQVSQVEEKMVKAELDRQERIQKAPTTARLLMTEYKSITTAEHREDGESPRFNLRLREARLERIRELLRDEYSDLVEFVDDKFAWKKGKEVVAYKQDRLARKEWDAAEEVREREEMMERERQRRLKRALREEELEQKRVLQREKDKEEKEKQEKEEKEKEEKGENEVEGEGPKKKKRKRSRKKKNKGTEEEQQAQQAQQEKQQQEKDKDHTTVQYKFDGDEEPLDQEDSSVYDHSDLRDYEEKLFVSGSEDEDDSDFEFGGYDVDVGIDDEDGPRLAEEDGGPREEEVVYYK